VGFDGDPLVYLSLVENLLGTSAGDPVIQLALGVGRDACGSRWSRYMDFVFDPWGCPQTVLYLLRRQVEVAADEEWMSYGKSMSHDSV
jgi:hypothetical protein